MRFGTRILVLVVASACGSVGNPTKNEPTITSIMPDHGGIIGGTMVTVSGKHFGKGTAVVVVGENEAMDATIVDDSTVTFTAPPGVQEGATVDVTVSTSNGFATAEKSFTYNYRPIELSMTPNVGKAVGGTMITVTGRGFTQDSGVPTVTIGGVAATNVQIVDDKTLTFVTGPAMVGTKPFTPLDVVINTPNGVIDLPKSFAVTAPGMLVIAQPSRCCGKSTLWYIDPTGVATQILTSLDHLHACASSAGQVYAVQFPGAAPSVRNLVTLDLVTGGSNVIGPLVDGASPPVNHNIASLVFDGTVLYGLDTGGERGVPGAPPATNKLVTINPATGLVTLVGNPLTIANRNSAIAVKDANNLYYTESTGGTLDTISVSAPARVTGPAFSGGSADQTKGMVNTGTTLYIAQLFAHNIYQVTVGGTAALTAFSSVPQPIVGFCQLPSSF